jgi:transposase InsO family protein
MITPMYASRVKVARRKKKVRNTPISAIGTASSYAWGRLYTSKLQLTAVQVMHNDVLPFFEEHGIRIRTVLSDNGREFCGRPDQHPYELFLQLEDIEHRTTRVSRPQSNGFIERFHRTLLDEHLRIAGRTKWYETVEEMQTDLDAYFEIYNRKRPHRGRGMEGRTPYTASRLASRRPRRTEPRPERRNRRPPKHDPRRGA